MWICTLWLSLKASPYIAFFKNVGLSLFYYPLSDHCFIILSMQGIDRVLDPTEEDEAQTEKKSAPVVKVASKPRRGIFSSFFLSLHYQFASICVCL